MLNKLKSKLEEKKAELGLGSSSPHHPPSQHPGKPSAYNYPPQSGYNPHPTPYPQQYPGQQPYGAAPSGGYFPPQGPPTGGPPPVPPRPPGYDQAPPPGPPPGPLPAHPPVTAPVPAPPAPSTRPEVFDHNETTPPASPGPEPPGYRSTTPFPESTEEPPEPTEQDIWGNIPPQQIVRRHDGTCDPLGGQVTGWEHYLHCDQAPNQAPHSQPPGSRVLGLYYPEWRAYAARPPSKLRADLATHVYYAFAAPSEEGRLEYCDRWGAAEQPCDGTTGCLNATRKLKGRNPGLKVILSLGGETGSKNFKIVAGDEVKRTRFVRDVWRWVVRYEIDGVDVDWEFPDTPAHGENYIALLRELRARLPRPRYQLTTALPAGEWVLRNIDLRAASLYLDYLNFMSYDMAGPWSETAGHQAALYPTPGNPDAVSASKAVDYALSQGFPPWKMVLGLPAYAHCFPGATKPGDKFDKGAAGQEEYRDLPAEWRRDAQVDRTVIGAWYYDPNKKGFVSFDTPETIAIKGEYVKRMGLAGMFFWHGVGDVWGGSLVSAASAALR